MTNNEVLHRVIDIFNFDDDKMIAVFALAEHQVSANQIGVWLNDVNDPAYQPCSDTMLAVFLNGLINYKRGKKEGLQPEPETKLTNNIIFKKLRIALNLKAEDVIEILALANVKVSKFELSAFSRKPNSNNYRECRNQFLFNFLRGARIYVEGRQESGDEGEDRAES